MWRIDAALLEGEATPPVAAMMPAISRTTMTVKPQHSQRSLEVAAKLGKKAADLSSATAASAKNSEEFVANSKAEDLSPVKQ